MPELSKDVALQAQVLVLGGGPAGTWAALEAALAGMQVVLADKGYCGVSGAAAASNNNIWYVPDSAEHYSYFEKYYNLGGGINEEKWVSGVMQTVVEQLHYMHKRGYRFPLISQNEVNYGTLRGPDYMRFMRTLLRKAKVTILDHCPVDQLLTAQGRVQGATGTCRDGRRWQVQANAVVIATGGCAFKTGVLGTNVNTGDGHLAAAEVGVTFSGMEFSNQYGMAASFSTVTKGLPFYFASFYDEAGQEIDPGDEEPFVTVARAQQKGRVFACFDKASKDIQSWLRSGQAIAFLPFDRMGIDPFQQRFELSIRLEGTVRGSGGIELRDLDCSTNVPGLFAAGDAASRELIVGGCSGGGSPNAAWAMASGSWAGRGAAAFVKSLGCALASQLDETVSRGVDPVYAMQVIREELWPAQRNIFRTGQGLDQSLQRLDDAWKADAVNDHSRAAREAQAMLLVGRLAYRSALARRESVALHRRMDFPGRAAGAPYRQRSSGVDDIAIARVNMPVNERIS